MSKSLDEIADLQALARGCYEDRFCIPLDSDASDVVSTAPDVLSRDAHVDYLLKGLRALPQGFTSLDASRTWVVYWCTHGLALLGYDLHVEDEALARDVVEFLKSCRPSAGLGVGGFGGGPGQIPHLATTYAATCALVTIGTDYAREALDVDAIRAFLCAMKDQDGGFRVHEGGEIDVRGCYAALATAHLCDILDDDLARGVSAFVARCQSYEGGIGGEPFGEAHGGYTFCGLAACWLARDPNRLDLPSLERWLANRQGEVEGGFNGRTNKLVDGCYSFWQGGCFPVLERCTNMLLIRCIEQSRSMRYSTSRVHIDTSLIESEPRPIGVCAATVFPPKPAVGSASFAANALQGWILDCCQSDHGGGGLRDKPGVGRDHYHTCYCLSGLSVAQHYGRCDTIDVVGPETNVVAKIDPVLNVVEHKYKAWMALIEAKGDAVER